MELRIGQRLCCGVGLRVCFVSILAAAWVCAGVDASGQNRQFKQTHSRGQYVHWIELYDSDGRKIEPAEELAKPYSTMETCAKCHDVEAISHGFHFSAGVGPGAALGNTESGTEGNAEGRAVGGNDGVGLLSDRPGEPWVWVDARTGTQIPVSYRQRDGLQNPAGLGISPWDFTLKFGRHLPGGGVSMKPAESDVAADVEAEPADEDARWNVAGSLDIDCMICHTADRSYKPDARSEQVSSFNFAWAATASMELGKVEGEVARLPRGFDPDAAAEQEGGPRLPSVKYRADRFDADGKAFFDVVRKPTSNACYYCHSTRPVGEGAEPKWMHDGDIHLSAGLSCSDCHTNGLDHQTVRGFEGEVLASGFKVETLSCKGCHYGAGGVEDVVGVEGEEFTSLGGRFGSPLPRHEGLPPLHFDELSCTACHSGPVPGQVTRGVQTSMGHALGIPSQQWSDAMLPGMVEPVWMRGHDGKIAPHRMMWPAYWGYLQTNQGAAAGSEQVVPFDPEAVYTKLRRVLRVRTDFAEELGNVRLSRAERQGVLGEERAAVDEAELNDAERITLNEAVASKAETEFHTKLVDALKSLNEDVPEGGAAIYMSGGKLYGLNGSGDGIEVVEDHQAAQPYAWPIGHDVRPARQSLGARGCVDCHSPDSPVQYGMVRAIGPAPDTSPLQTVMYEHLELDPTLLAAWDQSFGGRDLFKTMGIGALIALGIILAAWLLRAVGHVSAGVNRWVGGAGE